MSVFDVADHWSLNFVHKRLLGAAKSFVTSGFNPVAAAGGFFARPTTAPPVRRPAPRTLTARPSAAGAAQKELGRTAKFASDMAPRTISQAVAAPPREVARYRVHSTVFP